MNEVFTGYLANLSSPQQKNFLVGNALHMLADILNSRKGN